MKRYILILSFLFSTLFAGELHLEKNFKDAVAAASKSEKPVMFIVSRHTCKYCVILENQTLSNPKVIDKLNSSYVTYIAYTDDNDYFPDELWRPGTPAIWFLDDSGEPVSEPIMGAVDAENLLRVLDVVETRFKKMKKMEKYNYTRSKL